MSRKEITWTKEQLEEAIKTSNSLSQVEKALGITGNNYITIRKKAAEWGVDLGVLEKKPRLKYAKVSIDEIFCIDSKINPTTVRRYIIKYNLLKFGCSKCELIIIVDDKAYWNGSEISLQLDHINGINNDNRIENLRWLCPNCHAQTETFGGRNSHKNLNEARTQTIAFQNAQRLEITIKNCNYCMAPFAANKDRSLYCGEPCAKSDALKNSKGKNKITKEDLGKLVWEKPTSEIAMELGVTDKSIEKWCKQYNIEKPGRGYWSKKYAGKI